MGDPETMNDQVRGRLLGFEDAGSLKAGQSVTGLSGTGLGDI
jgi:hypothetical protein